jgi:fructokinase
VRIGIDIGGTKLESAAIDANGDIRVRRRVPTPKSDYAGTIEAIFDLVSSIEQEVGSSHPLGFGIPGTISPATGLVKNAYNSPFNDRPLDTDLAARFSRPVRLMNDANCFALSEANGGAGAGFYIMFGAILGTGCGSGITINEELLTGANNISGEWGHNPLPWPTTDELHGLKCKCAKWGCIETFLSGTGLERQHAAFTTDRITAEDIVAQAESGDAQAEHSLDFYENRLARALASIINVIDPNVIVLGGGLSNVARLYENVPKLWSQWVFSDQVDTLLLPPKFGDSSGVRGAAWLWAEGE